MKAALRLAFCALGFLTAATTANAQFEKLQPSNYAVWSPVVGSGAIYQIESQGKSEVREITVIGKEFLSKDTGYWLETRITIAGQGDLAASFKQLVYKSGENLLTDHFVMAPFVGGEPFFELNREFTDSARIRMKLDADTQISSGPSPIDFRTNAKHIRNESLTTWAGTFECEVWRTKKDDVLVWFSPAVKPFGLVKLTSKFGEVTLAWLVTGAKARISIKAKTSPSAEPTEENATLYSLIPGVWNPVVGSGAEYQFENKGVQKNAELAVVGVERRGAEEFYWFEVYAPCIARNLIAPDEDIGARTNPNPFRGNCINKYLMTDEGLIGSLSRSFFTMWDADAEGSFSILGMLQDQYGQPTWHPVLTRRTRKSARASAKVLAVPNPPRPSPSDFRERAELIAVEEVKTPAGTFLCEHWRSEAEGIDVWLNELVTPLGLVKKTSKEGNIILTKIITNAKMKLKENNRWKVPDLEVELRSHN